MRVKKMRAFYIRPEFGAHEEHYIAAVDEESAIAQWATKYARNTELAEDGGCAVLHVREGQTFTRWAVESAVRVSYRTRRATEDD